MTGTRLLGRMKATRFSIATRCCLSFAAHSGSSMDQPGHTRWGHQSPNACHYRQDWARQGPYCGAKATGDDDWEADPDFASRRSRESGGHEMPDASTIADLSQCFQGCSLQNRTRGYADLQRPHLCRENPGPAVCQGLCHLRHSLTGNGRAPEGLLRKQDGSRPSVAVSSSARILPQCQISHVQRCRACQAFNRDQAFTPHQNCWAPLQEEGPVVSAGEAHREVRASLSNDRLGKVQQWLEQTWEERPPEPDCRRLHKERAQRLEWCPAYGGQKEGEPWSREAGDDRRLDSAADTRHRWKGHPGKDHQAPAQPVPRGDDASPSPATCTCLFCEQQRPRATLVSSKKQRDPSVEEVAVLLHSEKRVPRIVEAFERRTQWEAKMAQEERAFGRRGTEGEPKRGRHRSSSARPHEARSRGQGGEGEQERGRHREPGARALRGKAATQPRRCPSFMDRLRGIH